MLGINRRSPRHSTLVTPIRVAHSIRPILLLFGSNLAGAVAGGVFFLFASWHFHMAEMGHYALAISIQGVLVGLLGTGLSIAIIRLAADHLAVGKPSRAAGLVVMSVACSVTASLLIAGVGWAYFSFAVTSSIFTGLTFLLIVLWGGARAVLDCLRGGLLVQEQYHRVALLNLLTAFSGLGFLALMMMRGDFTLQRLLMAHVLGQSIGAVLGIAILRPLWRTGIVYTWQEALSLLRYARWPALSEGTKMLLTHLGPLVLVAVAGAEEAGVFSVGRYPAYLFAVVGLSLYQYWLPQAVRTGLTDQLRPVLRQQMRLATIAGVMMVMGAFLIQPVLPLLGENFAAGASLLVPNALDFALLLLLLPIEAAYHGLHKPRLELYVRLFRLPLLLVVAFFLAARFGAVGMVWAHALSSVATLGFAAWLLWQYLGTSFDSTSVDGP